MVKNRDLLAVVETSKENFYHIFEDYYFLREQDQKDTYFWVRDKVMPPHVSSDCIFLWNRVSNSKTLSFIKIYQLDNQRTELHIHYGIESKEQAKEHWNMLESHLGKLGLLKTSAKSFDSISIVMPLCLVGKEEELRRLFHKGLPYIEIAEKMEVDLSTVKRGVNALGLSRRKY